MYFCAGFVVVDKAEEVCDNTQKILEMCERIKDGYPSFDHHFFHQNQLHQISFFACLEQKGDFEDVVFNIYFIAREHNTSACGLMHCKDDEVSKDLMYVWTFTPNGLHKHGDPFLSPLSEKLSFDGKLPFLSDFKLPSN